jgi:hypothetical protein
VKVYSKNKFRSGVKLSCIQEVFETTGVSIISLSVVTRCIIDVATQGNRPFISIRQPRSKICEYYS